MQLSDNSKLFIRKVSNISGIDEKVIKNVFHFSLLMSCLDLYGGANSISVPYFFDIRVNPGEEGYDPKYQMKVTSLMNTLVKKIFNGDKIEFEKYIKKAIHKQVESILL